MSVSTDDRLQIGTFQVDATPSVGDPIEYGYVAAVDDQLSCRGIVLVGDEDPIVLATIDWIGNYNGGYDAWRFALAEAAGTSPERVAVHAVHQHEAPGFDLDAANILLAHGVEGGTVDTAFANNTIGRASQALQRAVSELEPVTHVGFGSGDVKQVASNRQLLGLDGEVCCVRYSSTSDPAVRALPEGLVDPVVRTISFWNESSTVACLSYFATHPQSYYGDRRVTCDFVGLARDRREEKTNVPHIYFTGAAGNVVTGKYNDGTQVARQKLTDRLASGMEEAWNKTERRPIGTDDIGWETVDIDLPLAKHLDQGRLVSALSGCTGHGASLTHDLLWRARTVMGPFFGRLDTTTSIELRDSYSTHGNNAPRIARDLAWVKRRKIGEVLSVSCLNLSDIRILHLPGEPFVEYQIAASEMCPDSPVVVAGYGDGAPGYIGTTDAYGRGGFGVGYRSKVSPDAEPIIQSAILNLFGKSPNVETQTPSDITQRRKPRIAEYPTE